MTLTERQTIAITNPCATPADALDRRFYRTRNMGPTTWMITCLTVNK